MVNQTPGRSVWSEALGLLSKRCPRRDLGWGRGVARRGSSAALVAFLIAACFTGCGSDMPQVSGVVTLDGAPLASDEGKIVRIVFSPIKEGAMAVASTDESGRYTLSTGSKQGVVAGEYNASVVAMDIVPSSKEGEAPFNKRTTPLRYANPSTSGLSYEVKAGSNAIDLSLTSAE